MIIDKLIRAARDDDWDDEAVEEIEEIALAEKQRSLPRNTTIHTCPMCGCAFAAYDESKCVHEWTLASDNPSYATFVCAKCMAVYHVSHLSM